VKSLCEEDQCEEEAGPPRQGEAVAHSGPRLAADAGGCSLISSAR
jgi:hypothetical protein